MIPRAPVDRQIVSDAKPTSDILVVDDTPENLVAIEAALGDFGGELVTAQQGREALRHLLDREFALILLDVRMPDMDGFETARLIRERPRTRHVPIIFITAYDRADDEVREAYKLGAVDFLFKPINEDILRAKVGTFVELQRRARQLTEQAAMLREHEQREHERQLTEQRHQLEEVALRKRLEEEQNHAAELGRKAEELARTVEERERAEAALRVINAKLADDDRRKDEFLAVLAHELRNPLAPLAAGLELFDQLRGDSDDLREAHAAMTRQLDHLVRLVDDLLDISRITSGKIELKKEPVLVGEIIQQACGISRPLLEERNHELVCNPPDRPVRIDADPTRLAQIVSNLLNNAARYTDSGGRIEVAARVEADELIINVKDNGRGMPPELLDRVFEIFVQGHPDGSGLGLGLTLVKRLTELHGGTIVARSAGLGQGTEFELRLPGPEILDAQAASTAPATEADGEPDVLRIVLIEDNDDIRDLMQRVLQNWGHTVSVAANGGTGIELCKRDQPDVAIVDIGLPDMDGYRVAQEVLTALNHSPPRLIALTGFSQEKDRRRARDAGFDAHLAKPASKAALERVLRKR